MKEYEIGLIETVYVREWVKSKKSPDEFESYEAFYKQSEKISCKEIHSELESIESVEPWDN